MSPGTFAIKTQNIYIPVVNLLTQDNTKQLGKLNSMFKRIISCNKHPSFQGVNRQFVLSLERNTVRTRHEEYYFPTTEVNEFKK